MYITDYVNQRVYEYNLGTPFLVSTAVFSTSFNESAQIGTVGAAMKVSPDGTKLFVDDYQTETLYSYTLSTPYSIATAVLGSSYK